MGIQKNSSNVASRAELGRTPLYPNIFGATLRYWCKLITQSKSKLLAMAYHSEMTLSNKGKFSWIEPIKHLIDLAQINTLETYDSIIVIKNTVKELQEQYKIVIMQHLNTIKFEKELRYKLQQ